MGVGIVASIAFDPERDRTLEAIEAGHLFEHNLTRLAFRRNAFLRSYVYAFIETFAPPLNRQRVDEAIAQAARHAGKGGTDDAED
jgi:LysR family cys regulon transcriptional activator